MERVDWEYLAYEHGFNFDDRKMLKTLYASSSLAEVSSQLGVSTATLSERMDELGLPRRTRSEASIFRHPRKFNPRFLHHKRGDQ